MKKAVLILAAAAVVSSGCGQARQPKTSEQNKTVLAIIKLSENKYLLPEGDTLSFEEKPFCGFFEGAIDGKKVQAYVDFSHDVGDLSYVTWARIYMEDSNEFIVFWRGSGDWESRSEKYQIYFDKRSNFRITEGDQTYELKESEIKFQARDELDYSMIYCDFEGVISYNPRWEYMFAARPTQYPDHYATLFNSNPKYFSTNQTWKHSINLEIKEGNEEDGDCFTYFNQDYYRPLYIDSAVFVISHFTHVYMGGAHGMYSERFFNFNVKTGNLIDIRDIIDIDTDFISFYTKRLTEKYSDQIFQESVQVSRNFYLLPTGITFQYDPYELMSFAMGMPTLFLSYEELKPFLIFVKI